ncbi:kinesin heavy chain, putative [Babesia ovis]|uniref:Kinesin heavy chain, putative n=1 Tax=Babesia ovis TaxID=5869 RepID=A0A9W5TF27_BABOV|nr:kinesin heavy chain, putative [Babesia ovis]
MERNTGVFKRTIKAMGILAIVAGFGGNVFASGTNGSNQITHSCGGDTPCPQKKSFMARLRDMVKSEPETPYDTLANYEVPDDITGDARKEAVKAQRTRLRKQLPLYLRVGVSDKEEEEIPQDYLNHIKFYLSLPPTSRQILATSMGTPIV